MLSKILKSERFFFQLYKVDKEIAEEYRNKKCKHCGGPLHYANYQRQPRGDMVNLPEKYRTRFSLCCGNEGCRRRTMPPSCRFSGRKIYWYAFILIIMTLLSDGSSVYKLCNEYKIYRCTINRWASFFKKIFPYSKQWQRIRGQIHPTVTNNNLPASLLNYFINLKSSSEEALLSCLKLLSKGQSTT